MGKKSESDLVCNILQSKEKKILKQSGNTEENLYLVYTDVIRSTELDKRETNVIEWRKNAFYGQLDNLLQPECSLALKSIGDALFILYNVGAKKDTSVKDILYYIWKATTSLKKYDIKIRVAVHKITGHKLGGDIANHIETLSRFGDIKILIESLKKDIFGTEVNRTARMLSLVHGPAILVSNEIACEIDQNAEVTAIKGGSIQFECNNKKFAVHFPVPILYMKGVHGDKDANGGYVVWELHQENEDIEEAILAPEFKLNQSFRLINALMQNAIEPMKEYRNISERVLNELSFQKPSIELRFYNDILWTVEDYFTICDPSFQRKPRKIENRNYIGSLRHIITKIDKNDDEILTIQGQKSKINIKANQNSITSIAIDNSAPSTRFMISQLAFTSYSDNKHKDRTRELLSKQNISNSIKQIEAQSIDLYKGIRFTDQLLKSLGDDKILTSFEGFGDNCILLLYQVYSDYLREATSETIFQSVSDITSCVSFGLTTGMTDGFILYKTQDYKNEIKTILTQLISAQSNEFYYKIYPVMIIMLSMSKYLPLKRNIKYLAKVSEWYNES